MASTPAPLLPLSDDYDDSAAATPSPVVPVDDYDDDDVKYYQDAEADAATSTTTWGQVVEEAADVDEPVSNGNGNGNGNVTTAALVINPETSTEAWNPSTEAAVASSLHSPAQDPQRPKGN